MLWNVKNSRRLGWLSLGIGAIEVFATRQLEEEMGIDDSAGVIRAFGVREIAAGVSILAQPGLNGPLVGSLWARLGGDILDLLALGEAARSTRRPGAVATITAIVMAVTGVDALFAWRSHWELHRTRRIAKAARARVRPTNASPARNTYRQLDRTAVGTNG